MKRSDLEPGCKAIIVSGYCKSNIGKIVTCLNYIGKTIGFGNTDLWGVDSPVLFSSGNTHYKCSAATMQRIDDDINQQEISENSTIDEVIHG